MWKTCLGLNGFISGKLHGYSYTLDEVLSRARELGFDGVEIHNAFDPFPGEEDIGRWSDTGRSAARWAGSTASGT